MTTIYTIGHSTRTIDEFIELLQQYGVTQLVDIRTVPGSRHNPQFGQKALEASLETHDIHYIYMEHLGGLRKKSNLSVNMGWHNESFRNYADYMQTDEFSTALDELIQTAASKQTAIMCAEAVPWRCHRSLVGDALIIRDIIVRDIMTLTNAPNHKLTKFAHVDGTTLTYPTDEPTE